VRVVQAFAREPYEIARFGRHNRHQYDTNMVTARISSYYFPVVELAGNVALAMVVGFGGWLVHDNVVTVGTVAAFVLYLGNLFERIQQLSQLFNTLQSAGAALNKLFGLLDTDSPVQERQASVDLPERGVLEAVDLTFKYAPDAPVVLDHVSIQIKPGERLALVGPTGAGKSVLLALMALQFRRYPNSQVFAFDFGGSIRAAALAMKGDWHDLGGALSDRACEPIALQPLARIDDAAERGWAAEWIAAILTREKIGITPEAKDHLWSALSSLASAPIGERTLTGFSVLLQSQTLKRALQPYCLGGPFGNLLDAEAERLGAACVQIFETEGLIGTGAAPAVLGYLFHRIEGQLDGRPTLLMIDEGWLALDDEAFANQIREWLKTLRKKNAAVIFATQSLSDIDGSAIAPVIIESCPTRLFLPNERAIEPQITSIYRRFGLNDRQIEILARATPKRDYYCQSRRGNRLFELGLDEFALAFTAASTHSDQEMIDRVLAQHGREDFVTGWLAARGLGWAADLIPGLRVQEGLS